MKTCVLIDGSSYLYRAHHALPRLTAADGTPTGALFGVVNMLRTVLQEAPTYCAFVLDAPGPNFRHTLDPNYKANRPPIPDELRQQIEPLCAIVQALGISVLRVPGVEADDVIGTLAVQARDLECLVVISSGDKDFAQLVEAQIILANTMTGTKLDSPAAVKAKYGVLPEQIVDYLALMGDRVDNVPGVAKCGAVTAAKWLTFYGSLQGVMEQAHAIEGKIGEHLRAALPRLGLNQQLVTIKTDVPLNISVQELQLRPQDHTVLLHWYQRYGLQQARRALNQIPNQPVKETLELSKPSQTEQPTYHTITTVSQLDDWVMRLRSAPYIAIDTETDHLDPMQANLIGISVSDRPGHGAYLPLAHDYPNCPEQLSWQSVTPLHAVLTDPHVRKVGQHGKYDQRVLERHGIELAGYSDDTLLQSFVLDAGAQRHDLDTLAKRHLNYETISYEALCGKGSKQVPFAAISVEKATHYAAEDADVTLRLCQQFTQRLGQEPTLERVYRDIEMPLVPVLARMENNGVCLDSQVLQTLSAELTIRMQSIREQATQFTQQPFNLDSTKQLQACLFDELQLPVMVKTPKGQPSTNEDALEAIAHLHPLPALILEYRHMAKLCSTYTDKLPTMIHPITGRIHTSYHQAGAATGRLSSAHPNLQNIPIRTPAGRRIRQAFIAPPGYQLLACDYSQIELRIMAHLSADPGLLHAFCQGADIHRATAAEVFGRPLEAVTSEERRAAKAINFGLMYGMSAFGLARQLTISRNQAQEYIQAYFQRYPKVQAFMDHIRQQARDQGYVSTIFGRRLNLGMIHSARPGLRASAERAAINAPMQGSAADIIKRAMIAIDDWLKEQSYSVKMVLQVHDELVFEVEQSAVQDVQRAVVARMEAAAHLTVPLVVDWGIGQNWDQAH